jgi:hypothetical protein
MNTAMEDMKTIPKLHKGSLDSYENKIIAVFYCKKRKAKLILLRFFGWNIFY